MMIFSAGCMAAADITKINAAKVSTTISQGFTNGGWVRAHAEWNTSTMWNGVSAGLGKAGSDGSSVSGTPTGDVITSPFTWLTEGDANDLQLRFDHVTGDTPQLDLGNKALATWYDAHLAFTLTIEAQVADGVSTTVTKTSDGTWKVRNKYTLEVLATGDYSITAKATNTEI